MHTSSVGAEGSGGGQTCSTGCSWPSWVFPHTLHIVTIHDSPIHLESGRDAAVLGGDADQGDIRACMREGGGEGVGGEGERPLNLCTDSQDYEPQPPGNRARRMRSP